MSAGLEGALLAAWRAPRPTVGQRLLLALLFPLELLFRGAVAARGLAYRWGGIRARAAPIPVISVGNLAVGGAGKTPVVLALAARLQEAGHRVAVLSRGYGAARRDPRIVSAGEGPLLPASLAGDEPWLLASRLPGVCVLCGPDRATLAQRAADELGATVAILDDGLQHRRLARDLEIVVVDDSRPLENGRLLPRGPLREAPAALGRAQLIWRARADPARPGPSLVPHTRAPELRSRYRPEGLYDSSGARRHPVEALAGRRVVALIGIARPHSFLGLLEALGAECVEAQIYGDHHPFTPEEAARAAQTAEGAGAWLVTTEKDLVRLPPVASRALALRVELELVEGAAALDAALAPFERR